MVTIDINDELNIVMSTFVFQGCDQALVRWALESDCFRQEYSRGDVVFSTGSFYRALGIVLSGRILVTKNRMPISRLSRGQVFGAAAMFNQLNSFATTLTCENDCQVVYFSQELLESMMRRDFRVAENYIRYQAGRIRFLTQKIDGLSASGAESKLARYLLDLGDNSAQASSMSELAEMLGIGRASLYRAIDSLCGSHAIEKKGKKLLVLDREVLEHICERND